MPLHFGWPFLKRHQTTAILICFLLAYLGVTLPFLSSYPILEDAQMGILAPAYKLAKTGIYGNDLFRGLYHAEEKNYEYMPLYPLTVALSLKLFGFGIWQARLVSILCGLLTLIFVFILGKQLFDERVGLLAVAFLVFLPCTIPVYHTGDMYPGSIPLLDFARVIRYDIMVVVWVVLGSIFFIKATHSDSEFKKQSLFFALSGFFVGLGTLSHLYGSFLLILFTLLMIWQQKWSILYNKASYWMFFAFFLTLVPWIVYILQDLPGYRGQMLRHDSRFEFLNINFYLDNLLHEPWRYVKFLGRFRPPLLFPRPGLWLLAMAVIVANITLWKNIHLDKNVQARFLWLALPVLAGLLAILMSFKRYAYIILILPFLALQAAYGLTVILQWAKGQKRLLQFILSLWIALAFLEGLYSIIKNLETAQTTTPLLQITSPVEVILEPDSRLVLLHAYWYGFANFDTYALDLVYNLSDPDFQHKVPRTTSQVLDDLDTDYILVQEQLLKAYHDAPASLPNDKVRSFWRELDQYLQENCQLVYTGPNDQDYKTLLAFACVSP